MKRLIFLIFLYLTHPYLDDLDYKVLICIDEKKYINQDIDKNDYIFGYVFYNNNIAEYYYNLVENSGLYQIRKISNIKFSLNSEFIIIELESGNLFINRNTLEHIYNNKVTAKCEKAKSQKFFFNLLNQRKSILNNKKN